MRNPSRLHQTVVMLVGMLGVCGVVSAASLDEEAAQLMHQRMSTVFRQCGGDHFTKYTLPHIKGYQLEQYRELTLKVTSYPVSQIDTMNGVEWKGSGVVVATAMRTLQHGQFHRPSQSILDKAIRPSTPADQWSEWSWGGGPLISGSKKHGQWSIDLPGWFNNRQAPDCASIPQ
jgi:hypothetical protein